MPNGQVTGSDNVSDKMAIYNVIELDTYASRQYLLDIFVNSHDMYHMSIATFNRHIRDLIREGKIVRRKRGRRVDYFPKKSATLLEFINPSPSALDDFVIEQAKALVSEIVSSGLHVRTGEADMNLMKHLIAARGEGPVRGFRLVVEETPGWEPDPELERKKNLERERLLEKCNSMDSLVMHLEILRNIDIPFPFRPYDEETKRGLKEETELIRPEIKAEEPQARVSIANDLAGQLQDWMAYYCNVIDVVSRGGKAQKPEKGAKSMRRPRGRPRK